MDLAYRLWTEALAISRRTVRDDPGTELTEDEIVRFVAPVLAQAFSEDHLRRRVLLSSELLALLGQLSHAEVREGEEPVASIEGAAYLAAITGLLSLLGQLRRRSFEELTHFLGSQERAYLMVVQDPKRGPEARYTHHLSREVRQAIGLAGEDVG